MSGASFNARIAIFQTLPANLVYPSSKTGTWIA